MIAKHPKVKIRQLLIHKPISFLILVFIKSSIIHVIVHLLLYVVIIGFIIISNSIHAQINLDLFFMDVLHHSSDIVISAMEVISLR